MQTALYHLNIYEQDKFHTQLHARIQKVLSKGVLQRFFYIYFIYIVLVDEGREGSNTTITAFRWRADDSSILNAGLVAFFYFQGIWTSIAHWVGAKSTHDPFC